MKLPILLAIAILPLPSFANSEISDFETDPNPHYAFLSGTLSAKIKEEIHDVTAFDGKKLEFDGVSKKSRPQSSTPYYFSPKVSVTNAFAEIQEFDYSFTSDASTRSRSEESGHAMHYDTITNIAEVNPAILDKDGNFDPADEEEQEENVQEMREKNQAAQEYAQRIFEGGFSAEEAYFDAVHISMDIIPNRDIRNAYGAVVLSYDDENPLLRMQNVQRSIVRVFPIGFLQNGVPNRVKCKPTFDEDRYSNPSFEIYIFSGNGTPVATSNSKALKKLTPELVEKFQTLDETL